MIGMYYVLYVMCFGVIWNNLFVMI